jgi:predicted RND superfamily exporter protein
MPEQEAKRTNIALNDKTQILFVQNDEKKLVRKIDGLSDKIEEFNLKFSQNEKEFFDKIDRTSGKMEDIENMSKIDRLSDQSKFLLHEQIFSKKIDKLFQQIDNKIENVFHKITIFERKKEEESKKIAMILEQKNLEFQRSEIIEQIKIEEDIIEIFLVLMKMVIRI